MATSKVIRAIILGAPASGKGTISARIVKNFAYEHISSGDLLRQNVSDGTPLGIVARKYIDSGQLVPDHLMIECLTDRIAKVGHKSMLLDGFPRTIAQAEHLWHRLKLDVVLNLVVPHEVIIERVQGRWVHLASGRVYNIGFNEPKVPFVDDVTGERLVQRADDKPETVQQRLEIYQSITKPVIKYYDDKGILTNFKGKSSDEIWPKVHEHLAQLILAKM